MKIISFIGCDAVKFCNPVCQSMRQPIPPPPKKKKQIAAS